MLRFFKSNGFKIFLIVLAVLIAGSITAAVTSDSSSPFTSVTGIVFEPIQRLSSKIAHEMSGLSLKFKSSSYYKDQVDELESELAECREQLAGYDQARQKIDFYENFLDIKEENPDYAFVSASIIGYDADDLFGSFTLNKGSAHGVSVNDTIIYNKYLVGVVSSVMATRCTVNTILNPEVYISAYETRTRESGYVETDVTLAKEGICRLSNIERTTSIAPGGTVSTSGTGGIYPRDLLIGEVIRISDNPENISVYAEIQPFVDLSKLIDVFIITDFSE